MALPSWLRDRRVVVPAALVLANTVLRICFSPQGLGPDANDYAYAALRLSEGLSTRECPWWTTPGDHFIRWGIVVPLAMSFSLFGVSILSLSLPGVFATGAIQVILYRFLDERAGPVAALATGLLLLFLPSIDFGGVTAYAHWIAALLVLCAVVAFDRALEDDFAPGYLRAGLFCGLAYVTWTLSVAVMAGLATAWLLRRRKDGRRFLMFFGAALGVALADVVLLFFLYGDPLYRFHSTAFQQQEHIALWNASFLGNWTAPFQPLSGVGRAMGLVVDLGLISSIVLMAVRRRLGTFLALTWMLPFVLMRLLPLRFSPFQFLALVEPHLMSFCMPLVAATGGLGIALLWEAKRPLAFLVLGICSGFGLLQMELNTEEFRTGTLYPARVAYELARARTEDIIACDFRTQMLFRFWDAYREGRRYLPIDHAESPPGKPLILVCNLRHLQVLSMRVSPALEQRRDRWELLGKREFPGRVRFSRLLRGHVERMPPAVVEVFRVPP